MKKLILVGIMFLALTLIASPVAARRDHDHVGNFNFVVFADKAVTNTTTGGDNVGYLLRGISKDELKSLVAGGPGGQDARLVEVRTYKSAIAGGPGGQSGGWMKIMKKSRRGTTPTDGSSLRIMNKAELIEAIASDANLTKADSRRALDAFIGATTKSLKGGKRVALVGFGSFSISKRKARTGENLQKVVKFKAGDMPLLPNVEYTTTEDIIKAIVTSSGEKN